MNDERGLTLIEICLSTTILAATALGVAATMMTGLSSNRMYRENTLVVARAQHFLETMYNLQIGTSTDSAAAGADLDVVFSGDPELGLAPPSLHAIAKALDAMPDDRYEFTPSNLGFPGTFLVHVTNNVTPTLDYPSSVDANADGIPDDGVASMLQGALVSQFGGGSFEADPSDSGRELFAFEIYYRPATPANSQPELVLRGFRAQDY